MKESIIQMAFKKNRLEFYCKDGSLYDLFDEQIKEDVNLVFTFKK